MARFLLTFKTQEARKHHIRVAFSFVERNQRSFSFLTCSYSALLFFSLVNAPFNGTGENYLGTVNRSTSGKPCEPWNKHEPKHNWAHNYCRNPSGRNKRAPWCYVGKNDRELCPIPRVSTTSCKLLISSRLRFFSFLFMKFRHVFKKMPPSKEGRVGEWGIISFLLVLFHTI